MSKLQRLLGNCIGGGQAERPPPPTSSPPTASPPTASQAISLSPSSPPQSSTNLCPNPSQTSTLTLDDLASQLTVMSLTLSTQMTEQVSALRQEVAECQEDNRTLREEVRRLSSHLVISTPFDRTTRSLPSFTLPVEFTTPVDVCSDHQEYISPPKMWVRGDNLRAKKPEVS